MPTSTAAGSLKSAMQSAIALALAPVNSSGRIKIGRGYPVQMPDDSVLVMGCQAEQEWRTSNRSREEILSLEIVVSCWRGSGQEAADDAAYDLLELIDRYCRVTDPTLVGAGAPVGLIREVALTSQEEDGFTKAEWRQSGRGTEINATFTAKARISG